MPLLAPQLQAPTYSGGAGWKDTGLGARVHACQALSLLSSGKSPLFSGPHFPCLHNGSTQENMGPDIQDDCADAWDVCVLLPHPGGAWEWGDNTGSVGEPDVVVAGPA